MGKNKKRRQIQRKTKPAGTRLQKVITEYDPKWVRAQLDLKPGWEAIIEQVKREKS